MPEHATPDPNLEHLDFLVSSFTDNGKSLRAFTNNPQELAITILTAGLLANSKLNINPEDAIRSAFDLHARIQAHVGQFQSMQFAANIENCFAEKPQERPPEVEHD
jgi:lauroyl/myristoyl acyltransferase